MRRISFAFTFLGILLLIFLLISGKSHKVGNYEELQELESNSKVFISGRVISERAIFGTDRVLSLDNEVELICSCHDSFKDKEINVEGIVSEYNGVKQIRVLRIMEND